MTVPTPEEAKAIISFVREANIVSAFSAAWRDWETSLERGNYSRWARTRANMVFERLAARLQEVFVDDPGVRFYFKMKL